MKRATALVQPAALCDVLAPVEADALEILQRAYRRDVEALADGLKARLVSGEFAGVGDAAFVSTGPGVNDYRLRFSLLEDLCAGSRWARADIAPVTLALTSSLTRAVLAEDGPDVNHHTTATFVIAYDVRTYAERHWHAPRGGEFGGGGTRGASRTAPPSPQGDW